MALPTLKSVVPGTLVAALLSVSAPIYAHDSESGGNSAIAPLFADHSPLLVTIEAPLTTLMKDRPTDLYLEGTFRFTGDDGTEQTLDLKLRTRGKYRRLEKHCDFAPIRLNFRKKQVVDTIFAGQDKLKLVTHCRNEKLHYEQLVLREYLAYRILQLLTDKSFGVRLLQINYVDTEGSDPITKIGFVIEDDDDVAERNGMRSVKTGDISNADLERGQQNLVNVFQYLIGNTEYSLFRAEPHEYCCHNSDLMSATEGAPFTPLAYDFDFAGLVNASYAQPNPRYKIENVRQRLYKGQCENNDLLADTFQKFLDNKEEIFDVVEELELLDSGSRRYVTRYMNAFYDLISRPKSINAKFINKCYDSS